MNAEATLIGVNYIPDNPKMAAPPQYVLQRLYDFDNMLVMFPSRHVPFAYVLARRRQYSAGFTDRALEATIDQPDTKMVMTHNCVPVTLIYKTGPNWTIDNIIAELRRRDIWAAGGAEKLADAADAADNAHKKKIKDGIRKDMWDRSGDAWRSYQARTGQRTAYRQGGTRTERRDSQTAPRTSGSTAGSGPLVTLT